MLEEFLYLKPLTYSDLSALGFLCEESSQVLSGVWRLSVWKSNVVIAECHEAFKIPGQASMKLRD